MCVIDVWHRIMVLGMCHNRVVYIWRMECAVWDMCCGCVVWNVQCRLCGTQHVTLDERCSYMVRVGWR